MRNAIVFLLPGPRERRSGGTLYDLRLVRELEELGRPVRLEWLGERFPFPGAAELEAADRLLAGLPAGTTVIVDSLALGAMPEIAARHAPRLDLVALVHHPLAFERGLLPEQARSLHARERAALAAVRRVLVTSVATRDLLVREFAVPFTRITVAEPGVDPAYPAAGSGWNPPQLLSVGALIPRKDHLGLVRALAHLADLPWRLDIVGSTEVDPTTTRAVREAITAFGFTDRIRLLGELEGEPLEAAFARADLFVSASHHEGYGMALVEAVARGIPVVATRGGAVEAVLPPAAALLVPPGHPAALAAALRQLLHDAALQARLRAGALAARDRLPRWDEAARTVLRLLEPEPAA